MRPAPHKKQHEFCGWIGDECALKDTVYEPSRSRGGETKGEKTLPFQTDSAEGENVRENAN